jgi:hypothetical protein
MIAARIGWIVFACEGTTMTRPNITEELERLIDATPLLDVLTGLECVCSEKAEHIRVNWQDKVTAKPWDDAAKRIRAVVDKVAPLGI